MIKTVITTDITMAPVTAPNTMPAAASLVTLFAVGLSAPKMKQKVPI